MSISLLVPFRTDDGQRQRVWDFLRRQWEARYPGLEVVVGSDYSNGQWCKAHAWRDALLQSTGDVVIFMDADCWVPRAVEGARQLVTGRRAWVQAQNFVWRLSQTMTVRVMAEAKNLLAITEDDSIEPPRYSSAGVGTILRRSDALDIPLDPRFLGWGWEDPAWNDALMTILGKPWRFDDADYAPCIHLWHPPAPGWNAARAQEGPNWELRSRYRRARGKPEAMRELLAQC